VLSNITDAYRSASFATRARSSSINICVAVSCSVLQCVVVCCSVLQELEHGASMRRCCSAGQVAEQHIVLHYVAVCVAVCNSALQCVAVHVRHEPAPSPSKFVLQYVAVCCSVL